MNKLQNPIYAIVGLILVLLVNIRHALYVYGHITEIEISLRSLSTWYILFMMLAIDALVVIMAIHRMKTPGIIFSVIIGIINLYYFHTHIGIEAFFGLGPGPGEPLATASRTAEYLEISLKYLVALSLAVVASYGIYFTTHIFVDSYQQFIQEKGENKELEDLRAFKLERESLIAYTIRKLDLSSNAPQTNRRQRDRLRKKLAEEELTEEEKSMIQTELMLLEDVLKIEA